MPKKVKIIKLKQDKLQALMQRTGKCRSTIYAALRYATFGDDPEMIRRLAIEEYGGIEDKIIKL